METKKLLERLIESFCSKDKFFHPEYTGPLDTKDGIVFTDGYIAVIVSKDLMPVECEYIKDSSILKDGNISVELTSERLQSLINRLPKVNVFEEEEKECSECNGTGSVIAEYHSDTKDECGKDDFEFEVTCPICEGSGKMLYEKKTDKLEINKKTYVSFDDVWALRANSLLKLQEAMKIFDVDSSRIVYVGDELIVEIGKDVTYISICSKLKEKEYISILL